MRPLSSITQHQSADVDAAPWSYHDVSTDIYTRKHLPSNHARQPCSGTKRSIDVCKYVARKIFSYAMVYYSFPPITAVIVFTVVPMY